MQARMQLEIRDPTLTPPIQFTTTAICGQIVFRAKLHVQPLGRRPPIPANPFPCDQGYLASLSQMEPQIGCPHPSQG
jgi:hypothetical protein